MRRPSRARASLQRALEDSAKNTLSFLGLRGVSVEVGVLPDATMKQLKKRFLGRDSFPDVLAFPESGFSPVPEGTSRSLGEVYLNESLAGRPERLRFLLVHGILHLLGYHHGRRHDMITMQLLEKEICSALGVRSPSW